MKNFIKILIITLLCLIVLLISYLIVVTLSIKCCVKKISKNRGEKELIELISQLRNELGLTQISENFTEDSKTMMNNLSEQFDNEGNIIGFNNADFKGNLTSNNADFKGNLTSNNANFKGNVSSDKLFNNDGILRVPDNYFDIDLRKLDSNGDFEYPDDIFYPLIFVFRANEANRVCTFTISGHCAFNYRVNSVGMYTKDTSGTLVSSGVNTILHGSLTPSQWGSTVPYGELTYLGLPTVFSNGAPARSTNLFTKCFGPVCFPSRTTSSIYEGKIPESLGKVTGNLGTVNGVANTVGEIDTLRVKGKRISEIVSICIYIRGARRYTIRTNSPSLVLCKDGCDIIRQLDATNSLLFSAARLNTLKIRNDLTNLGDPLIPLSNNDLVLPNYNGGNATISGIDINLNPNLFLVQNYFTRNKNGKFIYVRNDEAYYTDYEYNGISLKDMNNRLNNLSVTN